MSAVIDLFADSDRWTSVRLQAWKVRLADPGTHLFWFTASGFCKLGAFGTQEVASLRKQLRNFRNHSCIEERDWGMIASCLAGALRTGRQCRDWCLLRPEWLRDIKYGDSVSIRKWRASMRVDLVAALQVVPNMVAAERVMCQTPVLDPTDILNSSSSDDEEDVPEKKRPRLLSQELDLLPGALEEDSDEQSSCISEVQVHKPMHRVASKRRRIVVVRDSSSEESDFEKESVASDIMKVHASLSSDEEEFESDGDYESDGFLNGWDDDEMADRPHTMSKHHYQKLMSLEGSECYNTLTSKQKKLDDTLSEFEKWNIDEANATELETLLQVDVVGRLHDVSRVLLRRLDQLKYSDAKLMALDGTYREQDERILKMMKTIRKFQIEVSDDDDSESDAGFEVGSRQQFDEIPDQISKKVSKSLNKCSRGDKVNDGQPKKRNSTMAYHGNAVHDVIGENHDSINQKDEGQPKKRKKAIFNHGEAVDDAIGDHVDSIIPVRVPKEKTVDHMSLWRDMIKVPNESHHQKEMDSVNNLCSRISSENQFSLSDILKGSTREATQISSSSNSRDNLLSRLNNSAVADQKSLNKYQHELPPRNPLYPFRSFEFYSCEILGKLPTLHAIPAMISRLDEPLVDIHYVLEIIYLLILKGERGVDVKDAISWMWNSARDSNFPRFQGTAQVNQCVRNTITHLSISNIQIPAVSDFISWGMFEWIQRSCNSSQQMVIGLIVMVDLVQLLAVRKGHIGKRDLLLWSKTISLIGQTYLWQGLSCILSGHCMLEGNGSKGLGKEARLRLLLETEGKNHSDALLKTLFISFKSALGTHKAENLKPAEALEWGEFCWDVLLLCIFVQGVSSPSTKNPKSARWKFAIRILKFSPLYYHENQHEGNKYETIVQWFSGMKFSDYCDLLCARLGVLVSKWGCYPGLFEILWKGFQFSLRCDTSWSLAFDLPAFCFLLEREYDSKENVEEKKRWLRGILEKVGKNYIANCCVVGLKRHRTLWNYACIFITSCKICPENWFDNIAKRLTSLIDISKSDLDARTLLVHAMCDMDVVLRSRGFCSKYTVDLMNDVLKVTVKEYSGDCRTIKNGIDNGILKMNDPSLKKLFEIQVQRASLINACIEIVISKLLVGEQGLKFMKVIVTCVFNSKMLIRFEPSCVAACLNMISMLLLPAVKHPYFVQNLPSKYQGEFPVPNTESPDGLDEDAFLVDAMDKMMAMEERKKLLSGLVAKVSEYNSKMWEEHQTTWTALHDIVGEVTGHLPDLVRLWFTSSESRSEVSKYSSAENETTKKVALRKVCQIWGALVALGLKVGHRDGTRNLETFIRHCLDLTKWAADSKGRFYLRLVPFVAAAYLLEASSRYGTAPQVLREGMEQLVHVWLYATFDEQVHGSNLDMYFGFSRRLGELGLFVEGQGSTPTVVSTIASSAFFVYGNKHTKEMESRLVLERRVSCMMEAVESIWEIARSTGKGGVNSIRISASFILAHTLSHVHTSHFLVPLLGRILECPTELLSISGRAPSATPIDQIVLKHAVVVKDPLFIVACANCAIKCKRECLLPQLLHKLYSLDERMLSKINSFDWSKLPNLSDSITSKLI